MHRRNGRPSVADRKVPISVSIRYSILTLAREEGLDLGEIVSTGIRLALGKSPDEVELEKLEKEITELKNALGPKLARFQELQASIDRKRKLQLDLKMEEDCGSWYLRFLIQDGRIRVTRSGVRDLAKFVEDLRESFPAFKDLILVDDTVRMKNGKFPFGKELSLLKKRGFESRDNGLSYTYSDPPEFLSPSRQECGSRLKIEFDSESLLADLQSDAISGSMPVSAFRAYNPRILDESVKREIKSRMLPEYMQIHVEVER